MLFGAFLILPVLLGEAADLGATGNVHPQPRDGSNIGNQGKSLHYYGQQRPSPIQNMVNPSSAKPTLRSPEIKPPPVNNPVVGRKHHIVDLIDTDEEYDEFPSPSSSLSPPPLQRSRLNQPPTLTDEKRRCMLTYNLQDKTTDETHARMLRQEIGKLQDLVQVLRDQQYILNILNDIDEKSTDPKGAMEHSLIKHLKKLTTSDNSSKIEGRTDDDHPPIPTNNDKNEIVHLKHEVENLKELIKKPDLKEKLKTQEEEIDALKGLVKKLSNETEPLSTTTIPTTSTTIKMQNKARLSSNRDEEISEVLQELNQFKTKLEKFVASKNSEDNELVGAILKPNKLVHSTGNFLKAVPYYIPKINHAITPIQYNNTRRKPIKTQSRASTNSDIETLLELLNEDDKTSTESHNLNDAKINKLLKSLDSKSDIESRIEELDKLINKKKTSSSIEEQLKRLERKLKDDDDPKEELKKLRERIKMLNKKSKVESKSHVDDDLEFELETLQKAIKGLQPKEEFDDVDDAEDNNFEVMVKKLISTGGKKKLTHSQIQSLKKKLIAMKGNGGTDDDVDEGSDYGIGELITYDGGNTYENSPTGYGTHHHGNKLYAGKHYGQAGYSYPYHHNFASGYGPNNFYNGYPHVNTNGFGGSHGYGGVNYNYGATGSGLNYGPAINGGNYASASGYVNPNRGFSYGASIPTAAGLGYGAVNSKIGENYGLGYGTTNYVSPTPAPNYGVANSKIVYGGSPPGIGYGNSNMGLGYGNGYGGMNPTAGINYGMNIPSYDNIISQTGATPGYGNNAGAFSQTGATPGYGNNAGAISQTGATSGYGATSYANSHVMTNNPPTYGSPPAVEYSNHAPYGSGLTYSNPSSSTGNFNPTYAVNAPNPGTLYDTTNVATNPNYLPSTTDNHGVNYNHPEITNNADYINYPSYVDPNNQYPHPDPNQYAQPSPINYEQANHFFPAPSQYTAPSGQINQESYQEGAAINAQNPPQPYANPQQNPNDYTQAKVTDLKHQIYDLQNIISTFNKPEYLQNPEDKETVYKLDKQINDLKAIINNLTQDYPNGATVTYQTQPLPQPPPPPPLPAPPVQEYQANNPQPVYTQPATTNAYPQTDQVQQNQQNYATNQDKPNEYQQKSRSRKLLQKREVCNYEESPVKIIKKPHLLRKRDDEENNAMQALSSLFGKALLDPSDEDSRNANPPSYLQPNLLNDVNRRIASIQKQLEYPPVFNPPVYNPQPEKQRLNLFKKEDIKVDIFDKIFDKIIDKVISKIGVAVPKLIELFFGANEFQEYMNGGNGYNSGNGYSLENSFRGFGLSGFIPMIILKILSKIHYFVSYLQKYKFFKTFLVPALILLLVAGSIIFLVWWLQPNDDYNRNLEYHGGGNYAQGGYGGVNYAQGGYGGVSYNNAGVQYYRQANNNVPYPMYGRRMESYNNVISTNKNVI